MLIMWKRKGVWRPRNHLIPASASLWRLNIVQVPQLAHLATWSLTQVRLLQSVGAAWLMVSLTRAALWHSRRLRRHCRSSFLPAAGAIGDIVDRRKVIL